MPLRLGYLEGGWGPGRSMGASWGKWSLKTGDNPANRQTPHFRRAGGTGEFSCECLLLRGLCCENKDFHRKHVFLQKWGTSRNPEIFPHQFVWPNCSLRARGSCFSRVFEAHVTNIPIFVGWNFSVEKKTEESICLDGFRRGRGDISKRDGFCDL